MIYLPTIIQQVVDKINATLDDTSKVHYEFGRLLTITNQLTLREKNNLPAFPLIALLMENKIIGNNVKCSIIFALKTTPDTLNSDRFSDTGSYGTLYELIQLFNTFLGNSPDIDQSYFDINQIDRPFATGTADIFNACTDLVVCEYDLTLISNKVCSF